MYTHKAASCRTRLAVPALSAVRTNIKSKGGPRMTLKGKGYISLQYGVPTTCSPSRLHFVWDSRFSSRLAVYGTNHQTSAPALRIYLCFQSIKQAINQPIVPFVVSWTKLLNENTGCLLSGALLLKHGFRLRVHHYRNHT